jgi:putative membrane protein
MKKNIGKKIVGNLLLFTMIGYTMPIFALTKEETVYSKLDNEGSSYETIVSTHIKNEELLEIINDMSDLLNIKNVGGDESFTVDENSVIWNAGKNDIYYQGESTKELPVETSIKYELNGEEISAEDIIGKEGKVKITISYENKEAHSVNISGKNETLYTPFVVLTGTAIDNEINKNIEITNGKKIEKDGNTIVLGIAFPGLQNSLDLEKDIIDIPETIEITMDTTSFELGNMLTYITPRVLEDDETKITDKVKELYTSVDDMKSASEQIEAGAIELRDGTIEYTEKSTEFTEYMNQLAQGTTEAENGMKEVSGGINQLSSKSSALVPGVNQIAEGTETLKNSINYVANSAEQISTGATSINGGIQNISGAIDNINESLATIDTTNVETKIAQLNELKSNLTNINNALDAQINANSENIELATILTQQKAMNELSIQSIDSNITSLTSTAKLKVAIGSIKTGLDGDGTSANPGLKAGASALDSGTSALSEGLKTMDEKAETLVSGTKELSTSAKSLVSGINTIKTGTNQLSEGISTVNQSTNTLYSASTQLTDGSKTIAEGMETLTEGITEFNDQAIDKIYNYVNNNVKNLVDRVDALDELSKKYVNFAMKDEEMNGNVKFILMTDSLKKEE